jgi:hypothetical protein
MTLDEIVANSGAVPATKISDHEPILLTYKELAAKIRFSYARVRYLASTGFLDERGLCYVMGSPRVDWFIFRRTAFEPRRVARMGAAAKKKASEKPTGGRNT